MFGVQAAHVNVIERPAEEPLAVVDVEIERREAQRHQHLVEHAGTLAAPGVEVAREHDRSIVFLDHRPGLRELVLEIADAERKIDTVDVHDE